MPQQSIGRPFAKANLAHVDRIDPGGCLDLGNLLSRFTTFLQDRPGTWRILSNDSREHLANLFKQRRIESSSDTAGIHELTIYIISELERTEMCATLLRSCESDNYKVVCLLGFDLEPLIRPAFPISGIRFLCDDSFQSHRRD